MAENTVALGALGCFGAIVRNSSGEAIGVVTAEHCDLNNSDHPRTLEPDGRYSISFYLPINAWIGDSRTSLKSAGVVDKFFLPSVKNDQTQSLDFVFGAFENHSIQEVMDAYGFMKLPYAEVVASLKAGDLVYFSGWPADQPKNNSGSLKRQSFVSTVFGQYPISGNLGIVFTVVKANSDGLVCSPGASGSMGFVMREGKMRPVAVLSRGIDGLHTLTSASLTNLIFSYEKQYQVSGITMYDAVCGFAFETPTVQKCGMEVYVKQVPNPQPSNS